MVKVKNETSLLPKKNVVLVVEEKSTKPPGTSRFTRRKIDFCNENIPLFKNEIFTLAELCQQLLVNGFVQSYVDFYHLTHRVDPNLVEERGESQIKISVDDMIFIRDQLVKAELSRRQGDTVSVYSAFNKLADFYVENHDWKTSFFFHEKCLEVAQLTNDSRGEMSANHSLGVIYQLMSDFEGARAFHEKHEEIAIAIDVFEEIARANVELYKVYLVLAERYESRGLNEEALVMYFRCLEAAKKSWDRAAEGEANGKVGNLLLNRGEAQQCVPYLKQQSQIAADLGQAEGRCRACSALALALDLLGQSDKALAELTLVHTISEQAGDTYLQAQACKSLGTLYSKMGQLDAAVDILQRHFNLLKTILYRSSSEKTPASGLNKKMSSAKFPVVTSKDVDLARAYIGISKGNLLVGAYIVSLQNDLPALLDWKLNRTELPKLSERGGIVMETK
jgi:tetratricopeptide (TPR) repeat protein